MAVDPPDLILLRSDRRPGRGVQRGRGEEKGCGRREEKVSSRGVEGGDEMGDFNLALVVVAAVVCVLVLLFNVYLLINYQHPDDANQAYFPKVVVIFGLSIAAISILMLPADVANRHACRRAIYNGACDLTLPMKDLWLAVYIADAVLVFFVIPFAMFYYEGDQEKSVLVALHNIDADVCNFPNEIRVRLLAGALGRG